jgi:hypothetical protein
MIVSFESWLPAKRSGPAYSQRGSQYLGSV